MVNPQMRIKTSNRINGIFTALNAGRAPEVIGLFLASAAVVMQLVFISAQPKRSPFEHRYTALFACVSLYLDLKQKQYICSRTLNNVLRGSFVDK